MYGVDLFAAGEHLREFRRTGRELRIAAIGLQWGGLRCWRRLSSTHVYEQGGGVRGELRCFTFHLKLEGETPG